MLPYPPSTYALLGSLASRPMAASELVERMTWGVIPFFLVRARSGTFAEIKALSTRGLATAVEEPSRRRPKTVYTITQAGRAALQEWLNEPINEPVRLAFPDLLKVSFGNNTSTDELVARLTEVQANRVVIKPGWTEGKFDFPERSPHAAAMALLHARIAETVSGWARDVANDVALWPSNDLNAVSLQSRTKWINELAQIVERRPVKGRWPDLPDRSQPT